MSDRPLSRRFRLRRRNFPRFRPRHAPCGHLDSVGWLADGFLWIDGWLTLEPVERLRVRLDLGGSSIRREARCFVGPSFATSQEGVARRWVLVVPVGKEFATASRARVITLETSLGELQWIGGFERLVLPDATARLRHPPLPPKLLERLESFADELVHEEEVDPLDPALWRNLTALRHTLTLLASSTATRAASPKPAELGQVDTFGTPPADPDLSIILTLLNPPDLLEHHFPQLSRSRGIRSSELLLILGPRKDSISLKRRLKQLVELYRLPVTVLSLQGKSSWSSAAQLGARHARSDRLVFLHGKTLGFSASGFAALTEPLSRESTIGVATPVIRHFDGAVRSAGLRVELGSARANGLSIRPVAVAEDGEEERELPVDACGADCFAIRRRLFEDLDGFSTFFHRPDIEVIDLCLRARKSGHSVLRVPTTFTRFAEGAMPPLPIQIPSDVADVSLLTMRHPRGVPASTERRRLRSSESPAATVVIPTLEPGAELEEVLDRLQSQKDVPPFEILVIDSSSRDGTQALLRAREIRHTVIPRKEFNHGLTRNLGLEQAGGEIVAFLSQDALPSPGWLAGLLSAFHHDRVAGAYSRQIPRPNASPFVRDQLAGWLASSEERRVQEMPTPHVFADLPIEKRLETICFDNVSSAVRRSVALRIPFRDLPFGEDRDWAYRVLAAGYTVEYRPDSEVVHSHDRSSWYELRRTFLDHRLLHELLDPEDPPPTSGLVSHVRQEVFRLLDVASHAPSRWTRFRARWAAPSRAVAGVGGAYLGQRSIQQVASGSRRWRWISRRLTRGI